MSGLSCPRCGSKGVKDEVEEDLTHCTIVWFMSCEECEIGWDLIFTDPDLENITNI